MKRTWKKIVKLQTSNSSPRVEADIFPDSCGKYNYPIAATIYRANFLFTLILKAMAFTPSSALSALTSSSHCSPRLHANKEHGLYNKMHALSRFHITVPHIWQCFGSFLQFENFVMLSIKNISLCRIDLKSENAGPQTNRLSTSQSHKFF